MKYVKPNAEVIRIENEDIITASACTPMPGSVSSDERNCTIVILGNLIGTDYSRRCLSNGNNSATNNYDMMVQHGFCQLNSTGVLDENGGFGPCNSNLAGVTCSSSGGSYSGTGACIIGLGNNNNCKRNVGANSL